MNEVLIEAGRTLALRFKEKGQYLRSFVGREFAVHRHHDECRDHLLRGARDRRPAPCATSRCGTASRRGGYLVRGDGSTAHEGIFDLETGEFLRQTTQQGYRGDSCWSRGLAWALYGFSDVVTSTAAIRVSWKRPKRAPTTTSRIRRPMAFRRGTSMRRRKPQAAGHVGGRDRSVGIASAMPARARSDEGPFLLVHREPILRSLCEKHLAKGEARWEGILKGGVYHVHKELGVDESVMWGEYFFVEALDHALRSF